MASQGNKQAKDNIRILDDSIISDDQLKFIKLLDKNNGLIYLSCKQHGISHTTYYNWHKRNELFAKECNDINEKFVDIVEGVLFKHIKGSNEAVSSSCAKYYLSTKGHSRGYKERIEHQIIDWDKLTIDQIKYIKVHGCLPETFK